MSITSYFYEQNAKRLAEQYNRLSATSVHHVWCKYWPNTGDRVLDVGAGSGRDSHWLNDRGCQVIACEPCNSLREIGERLTGREVLWLNDELPCVDKVSKLAQKFDVILLSAVWMHLPIKHRQQAIQSLASLLESKGILVISLRYGGFNDDRESFPVSVTELKALADNADLAMVDEFEGDDLQLRQDIVWRTVVMQKVIAADKGKKHGA
ncbi:class I SAM-dependent methyltransferase [Vibrio sp. E150_011]